MRSFRRPAIVPPTLRDDGPGGRARARHVAQYNLSNRPPSAFPGHWTSPDIKGFLYAMQGRVCAYCAADIQESGIDVEHFRPKGNVAGDPDHGGYWWLAYEYTNYLLSCTICNQKRKGVAFPLRSGSARIRFEDRALLDQEERILFDPSVDDVEAYFCFDWTSPGGRIRPADGLPPWDAERVIRTLDLFRVNLRSAQRRRRLELQQLIVEKVAAGETEEVRQLAIRFRAHSIVAREILESTAPDALPAPEEELEWLVANLASELLLKLEDLQNRENVTNIDWNEAREYLWALAALWKDPPCATPDHVAQLLDRRGLKDSVLPYLEQL